MAVLTTIVKTAIHLSCSFTETQKEKKMGRKIRRAVHR